MITREETLKLLASLSEDDLKKFLYSCMDELCGRVGPTSVDLQSQARYTLNQLNEVVHNVNSLFGEYIAMDMDNNKMHEKYPSFDQNLCSVFHCCVSTRKTEIFPYVKVGKLSETDHLLNDYDWRLKWVIGSSTFSAMHEPLLSLDFSLQSGKGNTTINLELDKTELKHLIEALEKAQQSMFSRLTST